jgi:hypothetical protein
LNDRPAMPRMLEGGRAAGRLPRVQAGRYPRPSHQTDPAPPTLSSYRSLRAFPLNFHSKGVPRRGFARTSRTLAARPVRDELVSAAASLIYRGNIAKSFESGLSPGGCRGENPRNSPAKTDPNPSGRIMRTDRPYVDDSAAFSLARLQCGTTI